VFRLKKRIAGVLQKIYHKRNDSFVMPIYKNEKEKYSDIYIGKLGESYKKRHNEGYGEGLWGGEIIEYIKNMQINSICDVGCGAGRFCNMVSEFIPKVYGVDIASVITNKVFQNNKVIFLDGEAKHIPLENKSVEYVTSFDCLEHCPTEDIDEIFSEIRRVAIKGFIICVSSLEDSHDGVPLHLTVKPQEWWYKKVRKMGEMILHGGTLTTDVPYIICKFNS